MSEEVTKLPPRAFGSIMDMLSALRGKDGHAQRDILAAVEELREIKPSLAKRLHLIAVAQQAALNKADGR